MTITKNLSLTALAAGLLAACAQTPQGPTVQVLPGRGKSFEAFQADQAGCTQAAAQVVQGQADRANTYGIGAAVLGTALGAGLGAAIGGGGGAGIGAAGGALAGTAIGGGNSGREQYGIQAQYNNQYAACMVAHGNSLPQAASPVFIQPQPYVVQPAPYIVQPAPYPPYPAEQPSPYGY